MNQSKEYYAFISYQRKDEKWAKWLQDKLEHYRFPTNLNGRTDLPKNIRPTFRDVTDSTPGLLVKEIDNAIRNSEWLIVICSPRSAKSPWVCKEAQTFINLGRADHIIPFVIEGNPFSADTATECYPEALLNLTGNKELLAANINEMGRDAAVIKVVARMFNLRFDVLWQRYEREQKRKRIITIGLLTLLLVLGLGVVGWITHQNMLLKEKEWQMMKDYSREIAQKAATISDSRLALLLLLEVLPEDIYSTDIPYMVEAEAALRKILRRNEIIYEGHFDEVFSATFLPNGKTAASISQGIIKVWDVKSGNMVSHIFVPGAGCFVVSPDGKSIYSEIDNFNIGVFDIVTGKCLHIYKGATSYVNSIDINSDRKIISIATDNEIIVWNLNSSKQELCIHKIFERFCDISISPDGNFIVSASFRNCNASIWNIQTGKKIMELEGHTDEITCVSYSPNGEYIATASRDKTFRVWNAKNGKCIALFNSFSDFVDCISFSPDSYHIASASRDKTVKVWSLITKKCEKVLKGHTEGVNSVSYSPDGTFVISASSDSTIRIWDIAENDEIIRLDDGMTRLMTDEEIFSAILSDDDNKLITFANDEIHTIRLWSLTENKCLKMWNDSIPYQEKLRGFRDPYIAEAEDGTIYIKDTNKNKTIKKVNIDKGFTYAKCSHNGKFLATTCIGEPIRVYDLNDVKCIYELPGQYDVRCVSFSVDDRKMATSSFEDIKIWDLNTGVCLKTLLGHTDVINHISFSSDSQRLVSCSRDKSIRVWDCDEGKCLEIIEGHTDDVRFVSFFNDNRQIISASFDKTIRIWNFPTYQECLYEAKKRTYNRKLTQEERQKYLK